MATYTIPYQNLNYRIPDDGEIFRGPGDFISTLYKRIGNEIKTIDVGEIGKQAMIASNPEKDQYGNYKVFQNADYGTQVSYGHKILEEKYGFDYNQIKNLPQINMGDLQSIAGGIGLSFTGGGTPDSVLKKSPTIPGQSYTQTLDPTNPHRAITSAVAAQPNAPSGGLTKEQAQVLMGGMVATPEQIAAQKKDPNWVEPQSRQLQFGNQSGQMTEINPSQFGISQSYVDGLGEGALIGHGGVTYVVTPGGNLRPRDEAVSAGAIPYGGAAASFTQSTQPSKEDIAAIDQHIEDTIGAIVASGSTPNPKLTPEDLKDLDPSVFLAQAEAAIAPEYKEKFQVVKDNLTRKLTEIGYDLNLVKEKNTRETKQNLETGQEELAGRGLTFSGQRQKFETDTEQAKARADESARTLAFRGAQDVGSEAEGKIGTSALQGSSLPSIEGRSPFSFSSTPLVGSLTSERQYLKESMARELETQDRARKAYSTRSLAFS